MNEFIMSLTESRLGCFLLMYAFIVIVLFFATISDMNNTVSTPSELHDSTDLNMFGCILLFIVYVLLNPLLFICKFIYWIFHVGR